MNYFLDRVRKPVQRTNAETYLLLTLLSFASSVVLTRLFLEITGYPQLGSGGLHFAHVLWGGLLLFVAALLPLIFFNRWALTTGAILAGLGVGLFIDEVGKFITQSNDYFHPAAAPIVYAFFLLTVVIYLRTRRQPRRDPRTELYSVLARLQELLDQDLQPREREAIEDSLQYAAKHAQRPDLARLSELLLEFTQSSSLKLAPELPSMLKTLISGWAKWERRWLTRNRLKAGLAGGLAALGLTALLRSIPLVIGLFDVSFLESIISLAVSGGLVASAAGLQWFVARVLLEGAIGMILLLAAVLLIAKRERIGLNLAYAGLLFSLAAVNLLVFYFEQFSTILFAAVQFTILMGVIYYRNRHL